MAPGRSSGRQSIARAASSGSSTVIRRVIGKSYIGRLASQAPAAC
jgi:hypothetical protein